MTPAEKSRLVAKLSQTDTVENPENDLLFPPPLDERDSVINALIKELRADRLAEQEEVTKRLHDAIAKEGVLKQLFSLQKDWVQELAEKAESSGELVGAEEAAKSLDLPPATLRYYAEQGIIPCFKMGRNRKYNLREIKEALEQARQDGKVSRVTAEMRKRILR